MDPYCCNYDCTISIEPSEECFDFVKGPNDINCHLFCELGNCTRVPNFNPMCVIYTCWPISSTSTTSTTTTSATTTTTSTTTTTTPATTTTTQTPPSPTPTPLPGYVSIGVALTPFILVIILTMAIWFWMKTRERQLNQVSNLIRIVQIACFFLLPFSFR